MPTIELSEKPRVPNSSRAASRILRSVFSPRAVRGALPSLAALGAPGIASLAGFRALVDAPAVRFVSIMPHPQLGLSINQVESWFNFHYESAQAGAATWKRTPTAEGRYSMTGTNFFARTALFAGTAMALVA